MASAAPARRHEPPLVLIGDDQIDMRIMIQSALKAQGYRTHCVGSALACLEAFPKVRPDLVILDAMMPGEMDGITCCAALQTLPGGDRTPVLMMTELRDDASVDRAFEAGATDYITKPPHWAVFRQRVRRLLDQMALYRQLEAANAELLRLATTDALTQVANRRLFDETLTREWKRAARAREPLALLLCDVDHFKAYNDRFGHQMGDDCLVKVASAMRGAIKRPGDLLARYGGEEFAVLLPGTSLEGALHVGQEMVQAVRALSILNAVPPCSDVVTLSVGAAVCACSESSLSPKDLITAADAALYAAKTQGRDRVVTAATVRPS